MNELIRELQVAIYGVSYEEGEGGICGDIAEIKERLSKLEKRVPTHWLTIEEAGEYLRVSKRSIMRWIYDGKIKYHKTGFSKASAVRIRAQDLDFMMIPFLNGKEVEEGTGDDKDED